MTQKVVTVIGATGVQGGSVVRSLLKEGGYAIRAITRNIQSEAAKELASQGAEIIKADLNDQESLVQAFEGSHAIFAVTDFFEPFGKVGPEEAIEVETKQGINIMKAAAATTTLEHLIWSTLPNASRISGGKYSIPHFVAKNNVDDYIKSDSLLYSKTTFLWVTYYASNYYFPMFTPYLIPTSGQYVQIQCVPPTVGVESIGDAGHNVGVFVKAILANPKATLGRSVLARTETTTTGEMLETWATAQGKKAQYLHVDEETYNNIWPQWANEMGIMMKFWDTVGNRSWSGEPDIVSGEKIGVQEAELVTLKDAFAKLKNF